MDEALMVRAKKIRALPWDILQPFDVDAGSYSPHELHKTSEQIDDAVGNRARVGNGQHVRVCGVFSEHSAPAGKMRLPRRFPGGSTRDDGINQFADSVDVGELRLVNVASECLLDCDQKLDPPHGVESEVEFEVVTGANIFGTGG